MTKQEHPITPPPELVQQWTDGWCRLKQSEPYTEFVTTQAARWGADQELKACYEWVVRDWTDIETADKLLAARRPKPPSLKEQALYQLRALDQHGALDCNTDKIRRALEALPE